MRRSKPEEEKLILSTEKECRAFNYGKDRQPLLLPHDNAGRAVDSS